MSTDGLLTRVLATAGALELLLAVEEQPQEPLVCVGDAVPGGVSLAVQLQQVLDGLLLLLQAGGKHVQLLAEVLPEFANLVLNFLQYCFKRVNGVVVEILAGACVWGGGGGGGGGG